MCFSFLPVIQYMLLEWWMLQPKPSLHDEVSAYMSLKPMPQTDLNYQFIWRHMWASLSIIIMVTWGTALTMSTEAPPAGFSSSVCQGQPIRWKLALKGGELKLISGSDWKAAPKSTSPGWLLFSVNDWKLCWVKK